MKREILVLRHGKSDWSTEQPDFQRPLEERGRRGSQQIGNWLLQGGLLPDMILSSDAERARRTAEEVCKVMSQDLGGIHWERKIYGANLGGLLELLQLLPARPERLLLVGHNPGLEDLLAYLVGPGIALPEDGKLLPTATLARLHMPDDWSSLVLGCATLESITRPADLPLTFPYPSPDGDKQRERPAYYYDQSAVVPFRLQAGKPEILLISSRSGKRWVVPKGIREPNLSHAQSARKEAWEEAGIKGRVGDTPLGRCKYRKWGGTCSLEVYPMEVTDQADDWEENFRDRRWVSPKKAASLLRPKALGDMVSRLDKQLKKQDKT